MDFIKKNFKWICVGLCALGFISFFFNYLTLKLSSTLIDYSKEESVKFLMNNGNLADGVFFAIFLILILVFVLIKKEVFATVVSYASVVVAIIEICNASSKFKEVIDSVSSYLDVKIIYGPGFWLMYIAIFALAVLLSLYCFKFTKDGNAFIDKLKNYKKNRIPVTYADSSTNVFGSQVQQNIQTEVTQQPVDQTVSSNDTTQSTNNTGSKFCSSCGTKVETSEKFCHNCGNQL